MDAFKYNYIIAEDESLIRKNLIKKINTLNLPLHQAGEASNGEEAISLIEQFCPHLVITDIRMPLCDGLEVAKYLYHNHPGKKIIILSGYDDFRYAQQAIQYSVEDYLLKPVTQDILRESLQKFLIKMENESEQLTGYHTQYSALSPQALSGLVTNYLQEHYQKDISFQEVSEKFGFTPEHVAETVKGIL